MVKMLYDDRLAPITSRLGFLECGTKAVADEFYQWLLQIHSKYQGRYIEICDVAGSSLESVLYRLLPLESGYNTRHLFIPTRDNSWTACFDNGWRGSDPESCISYLAKRIGCRGVRAVWIPNTKRGQKGRYGAVSFEVYGAKSKPIHNTQRYISLVNDGGRWSFDIGGEPFDFEWIDKYNSSRKTERFTPEMLDDYLKHLGIEAFSEDFYIATKKNPSKLISLKGDLGYKVKEYTLEQAREDY